MGFQGMVHPEVKSLPSFTQPQVVSNPYEYLSSADLKKMCTVGPH